MSPAFRELFSRNAGTAFAKQLAFADVLGERGWGVDLEQGQATFGSDLAFPVQLLGTESAGDGSWLWAWANEASNLPEPLLQVCTQLKQRGEQENIPELTDRSFAADVVNGHVLALVASGMNSDCCYYRGPYDGGALYFLVCDAPAEVTRPVEPQRVMTVVSQVISQFDVDHRVMVRSFLSSQGFSLSEEEFALTGTRSEGPVRVSFDEAGRIANLEGSFSSQQPEQTRKKGWKFWRKS